MEAKHMMYVRCSKSILKKCKEECPPIKVIGKGDKLFLSGGETITCKKDKRRSTHSS